MAKIHKDDNVQVLVGKDRGKTGKVLRVFGKEDKVLVEGVNMFKRHIRKMGQTEGGIIDVSKPVNISNIGLVCPACKKVSRAGFKVENGKKSRICIKCKEVLNAKTKG